MTDVPAIPAPRSIPTEFVAPEEPLPAPDACPDGCGPDETCCKCPVSRIVDLGHTDAPERDAEAVAATPTAPAPPPEAPDPMAAGTYAVYEDGQGGYVLVLGTREGETHRKHVSGYMVKMAEKMAGNNPLSMLFGG